MRVRYQFICKFIDKTVDRLLGTTKRVLTKKQLKRKVDSITSFRITFTGTPEARTTSVSSADLQTALGNQGNIIGLVKLDTIRKCGKLYVGYRGRLRMCLLTFLHGE
jgi:hypothetical protein